MAEAASVVATDYASAREAELQREAACWDPPSDAAAIPAAGPGDIPCLDLAPYLEALAGAASVPSAAATKRVHEARVEVASALRDAGERTGFCAVRGFESHIPAGLLEDAYSAAGAFHALPEREKLEYEMDNSDKVGHIGGVGYLREGNTKLPARDKPNFNESFLIKREHGPRNITLHRMPWPRSTHAFDGGAFRDIVTRTAAAFESLAQALLPLYACALALDPDYFAPSFESPLFRMRLSRYAPTPAGEFGINPHIDTSFFTLLATTDATGLVVFSHQRREWVRAQHIPGALIVNTGETLSRITNDQWPATRHYALNPSSAHSGAARYSIPFFFNPTATAKMHVVPTCCRDCHPKYPPVSYLEGQGVAQGE
jgi:isopenicillin N synthase-like dioxygenase